jgi:hypothetical protein
MCVNPPGCLLDMYNGLPSPVRAGSLAKRGAENLLEEEFDGDIAVARRVGQFADDGDHLLRADVDARRHERRVQLRRVHVPEERERERERVREEARPPQVDWWSLRGST